MFSAVVLFMLTYWFAGLVLVISSIYRASPVRYAEYVSLTYTYTGMLVFWGVGPLLAPVALTHLILKGKS